MPDFPDWIAELRAMNGDVELWAEMVDVVEAANDLDAWGGPERQAKLRRLLAALRGAMLDSNAGRKPE